MTHFPVAIVFVGFVLLYCNCIFCALNFLKNVINFQVNLAPSISSSGEHLQLSHHGSVVGSSLHNDSYLMAQENSSPSGGLGIVLQSITPQINGKPASDEFELLIRNMAQVNFI